MSQANKVPMIAFVLDIRSPFSTLFHWHLLTQTAAFEIVRVLNLIFVVQNHQQHYETIRYSSIKMTH